MPMRGHSCRCRRCRRSTLNGLVHFRLLTNRPVTWRWILLLSAMDITLITASISIGWVRQLRLRGLLSGSRAVLSRVNYICRLASIKRAYSGSGAA